MKHGFKLIFLLLMLCCCNIFADILNLPPFNAIATDGNFNLYLSTGGTQQVDINANQLQYVNATVEDGTLELSLAIDPRTKKPFNCLPIAVRIQTPSLTSVSLSGNSTMTANNLGDGHFNIIAADNSRVILNGIVKADSIEASGNSVVRLRWIDSNQVAVLGEDNAQIYLAGTTKLLQAKMQDQSFLDAKYLRPKVALVQTKDTAVAEVLAIRALYSFATGDSDIYYYKTPQENFLESSYYSGDILQLDHWQ